jgi:methyl-accepting chemotaxis protein
MNMLSLPAIIMAGITFYVGFYHLFIYIRRHFTSREDLTFAITCFTMGLYDIFGFNGYNTTNIAEGIIWQKAQVATLSLIGVAFIWFIIDYTSQRSKKIRNAFSIYLIAASLLSLVDKTGLSWHLDKPAIKDVSLPFNLSITYYEVTPGPLTEILSGVGVLIFIYVFRIGLKLYKSGNKEKARPLLWSVFFFCIGLCNDASVHSGLYKFIYIIEYSYMGIVLLMAYSLSVAVVESAAMKEQAEKSYQKLAKTSQLLAGNSQHVNSTTQNIDKAMNEVTDGTQSQNNHIKNTRHTLQDLLDNINNISNDARKGAVITENTAETINSGIQAMKLSFDSIQDIEKSVSDMFKLIKKFTSHSQKIDVIVVFINDIASRVNILSLNAAIEATKVGNIGSGFMVIAKEIRLLAASAKKSTEEITELIITFQKDIKEVEDVIKEGIHQVKQSTKLTEEGMASLDNIFKLITEEQERLQRIATKIVEIKNFSDKVEEAMNNVASVSEQNIQTVDKVNMNTKEMNLKMAELNDLAQSLKEVDDKSDQIIPDFFQGISTDDISTS